MKVIIQISFSMAIVLCSNRSNNRTRFGITERTFTNVLVYDYLTLRYQSQLILSRHVFFLNCCLSNLDIFCFVFFSILRLILFTLLTLICTSCWVRQVLCFCALYDFNLLCEPKKHTKMFLYTVYKTWPIVIKFCLLYTSDAADE